ncbi:WD repeat protein [Tothia fuscella]|uniref:Serine-threonine kinase receptor-associated protein n=1 Tax=Tothia fuscella TaxID=1048955 RepID=A0A9P4U212_9PEZI|nr:WD repeat protein [Tothia fuscella]
MAAVETAKVVPLTCHGHSRPVTHLSFSPAVDEEQYYIVSACKDNNPMLRDGITGDWIGTFIGHKGAVWQARLSSDATIAATGSADFSARVWDTKTGETLHNLPHNHIVRAVAFPPQPNPQILATGGAEKKLRIFDLSRGGSDNGTNGTNSPASAPVDTSANSTAPSYEIGPGVHEGTIKSIVWSPDSHILITAADDKKLRWWDLRTQSLIGEYLLGGLVGSCELDSIPLAESSSHGTLSVAAGKNVYFFEVDKPASLLKHIKTPYDIASVALNGKDRKFVTGQSGDTWVRVWDYDREVELEMGKGHHGPIWTCGFSPDGRLYATGSEDGTVKLWKFTKGPYGLWR